MMTKPELQKKIVQLLKTSTVSKGHKIHITYLLDEMDMETLEKVYTSLLSENEEMAQLDEKEKRLKFKFEMMVEKISGLGKN